MKQRLIAAIRGRSLWAPGDRVAVAASGGGDSMALLELLVATRGLHGGDLSVVSVDHGIHADSGRWAAAVEARARHHGLRCDVFALGLGRDASEADARAARYAVFDGLDVERVALAHHRRDQAETVLVNLLRGTGPRGLAGMAWRRGRYVRPLLDVEPEALHAWRPAGVVDDPANDDPDFLRVRIRTELLPLLEDIRTGATAALARTASLAREDADLLDELAAALPFTRAALAAAPRPVARRRLRQALGSLGTGVIEAALDAVVRGSGAVRLDRERLLLVGRTLQITSAGEPRGDPR